MGLREVLGHQVARSLVDLLLLADDADASAATRGSWLHDVHVFEVVHFTLVHPPLVILWEYVGWRADLEVLAVPPSLALGVSPEITLVSDVPGASEMV